MAKKKKNEDLKNAGCALVAIVISVVAIIAIVAVQLLPIVIPPASIICALVYWIKYRRKDLPHVKVAFQLSNAEKEAYVDAWQKYKWAKDKLEECERIIRDEGLRRRADGKLNQQSYRAQDVQGAIDNATRIKEEYDPICSYYYDLPTVRYNNAKKHFSRYWAYFLAFVIWGIIFATQPRAKMMAYHLYQTDEAVSVVTDAWTGNDSINSTKTNETSSIDKASTAKDKSLAQTPPQKPDITIWELFFIAIGVYLIVLVIAKIYFSTKHKEPKK